MKITIKEKKEKICVTVTFKARARDEKVQYMDTAAVKEHLQSQNYNLEHYTLEHEPHRVVHNSLGTHRLSGEWIFVDQRLCDTTSVSLNSPQNVEKVLENKNNKYENNNNVNKKPARKKRQTKAQRR